MKGVLLMSVLVSFVLNSPSSSAVASPAPPNHGDESHGAGSQRLSWAIVNITYRDPSTGSIHSEQSEMGLYGSESRTEPEWGWVVHIRTADNKTHGCSRPVNAPAERWIALIERGTCKFQDKILNAAILLNASAVVIYNHEYQDSLLTMKHTVSDVVSIFIHRQDGERLAAMVDNGTRVLMHISFSRMQPNNLGSMNRTSVLFVAISFIVLMVISVAWLIFYYIQRFRYAHTKDRLPRRLMNAAKKAVNRMGQRTLHKGDRETDPDFDLCAICVEGYKVSEKIRILPCRHIFHKSCVDPWLIEHRSCPICKLDILQACGIHHPVMASGAQAVNRWLKWGEQPMKDMSQFFKNCRKQMGIGHRAHLFELWAITREVNMTRESQGSNISANTDFETPYFLVEASELLLHDNIRYANVLERSAAVHTVNSVTAEHQEATHSLIPPSTEHREPDD